VGAHTWGNGETGTVGRITPQNSSIGSTSEDRLGTGRLIGFSTNEFIVGSPQWDDGAFANVGAATVLAGDGPFSGTVSVANSLIGSSPEDRLGNDIRPIAIDRHIVVVPDMDVDTAGGPLANAGAAILGQRIGQPTAEDAAFGRTADSGATFKVSANASIVAVGRPADNAVSLFFNAAPEGDIFADGFEDQ
jgi:hypothetical protein